MKKIIALLISVIGFFYCDISLIKYGNSLLKLGPSAPLDVQLEYRSDFEGGFTIYDKYGLSLVGEGVEYWENDLEVAEIVKYCFDNKDLIVEVLDASNRKRYLQFRSGNEKTTSQKEILSVEIIEAPNHPQEWVNIKNNNTKIKLLSISRNWLMFFSVIFILLITYKIFKDSRIK